jgi:patatin-like phospholipase/acyl hydrolase
MSDTIRILSIDGGGIRGIIPAMVLQALLGKLKAQDVFHIIAGTSTGGIIACGLAKPNPVEPEQIVNLYVQHGSEIFKKSIWDPIHYVYGPKYNSTALESYLASVLGDVSLSAVENVQLLVPSYAILLPRKTRRGTCALRCSSAAGKHEVCWFPQALTPLSTTLGLRLLLAPLRRPRHFSRPQASRIGPVSHSQ